MTKGKKPFQPLESKGVCQIYKLLVKSRLVSFPITLESKNKVDAIVASISNLHFGNEIYKTSEEKSVAYLYFLIKDHPFTDGNKRTASLAFEVVCALNDLHPNYHDIGLDAWAVYVEKVQEVDHQKTIRLIAEVLFNIKI
jgi:prophage maintenance system killer protein